MVMHDSALVLAAAPVRTAITHVQTHTADPTVAGTSNLTSAARQAVTWGAVDGDGDFSNSAAINFTGGAASGACTWVSYWTASSGGTCHGRKALTGDQTFNAAGEYTIPIAGLSISLTSS